MNLINLLAQLEPTAIDDQSPLPSYLLGCFRRKSISFFNGMTDEKTIVYWFQSKSFSIDLRLVDANQTAVHERQGWIGDTLWDSERELLSWQVHQNYQNHIQWPEPAKLYPIGNSILEFSPSHAYVEDWRQQAQQGLLLGLRLFQMQHVATQQMIAMDGGLMISDQHMAYAQSRLPQQQKQLKNSPIDHPENDPKVIESYEVSVALNGSSIGFSTISSRLQQSISLDDFEIEDSNTLTQLKQIEGELYRLYFHLDMYQPDFVFNTTTATTTDTQQWLAAEQKHLLKNATRTY
ncbi:hypothetical protein GCM10025882_24400 [Acinetobacter gyllenbergii]|uniref:Uncharacterized protein n=1 Tax=Acinetobacter gyllenbergii CIP 110306 = MTCC 11365 TaxID=1217657 RepID=A0A829HHA7_9GAMM|nr:hypothetical protein [Acinetobacter gyllenbergii]EPF83372.1 hypothetical protein F957_01718 [Acinetobacter gyllenbergii CIP 110306 = MTCC 11365]EPH35449.1 hypothetical protein L293_0040 [Acinetobacter gyllenbergii CIP 110306 = MTCC 11365]ESK57798.1 hypothetical protein F987_00040 [Acinetobacter gyllenbergii NIPH 230]GMA12015.1 hypothetical protein GCM10025882_24400 [Acinetobacter gyllenbergii]